jgi:integrase
VSPATEAQSNAQSRQHATAEEFAVLVRAASPDPSYLTTALRHRQVFVNRYPDLDEWFAQPLTHRVGRLRGEHPSPGPVTDPISHNARHYLSFLGITGRVAFDWEWLIAVPSLMVWMHARHLQLPLTKEAAALPILGEQLGYRAKTARRAVQWAGARIILHTGVPSLDAVTMIELRGLDQALNEFANRPDRALFHGTDAQWASRKMNWKSQLFLLQMLLYHRGSIGELPKEPLPTIAVWPQMAISMQATVERYLNARRQLDRPATMQNIEAGLRRFSTWLSAAHPEVRSYEQVTRVHCMDFSAWQRTRRHPRTGAPLAVTTRRADLQAVLGFFRDCSAWEWPDMPARPPMISGDLPKIPQAVPRFIPENELAPLMDAVRALSCPYQRAALLIARWSGARRGEIRMLELDCLSAYPDGTPRLRIPAGKTYRERMVPITNEAADAIRVVQALRGPQSDRALPGSHLQRPARRLFARKGRVLSLWYLFDDPLKVACAAAGLLDTAGKPTVSAHRFRHTVGTQLAERGARLHTIMSVLGHTGVSMGLVYAHISDPTVLADYQSVLGADAQVAGPSASAVRNHELGPAAVDWLKNNVFRTELELGHCLRLPAEGPCECDLFLSCAKFITTPAYIPRLQERHKVETGLARRASDRSWTREAERHQAVAQRIASLLHELGVTPGLPQTLEQRLGAPRAVRGAPPDGDARAASSGSGV